MYAVMPTLKYTTSQRFFFHVIFYVSLHFKINIIIPNLFSCQKTIPKPRPRPRLSKYGLENSMSENNNR